MDIVALACSETVVRPALGKSAIVGMESEKPVWGRLRNGSQRRAAAKS